MQRRRRSSPLGASSRGRRRVGSRPAVRIHVLRAARIVGVQRDAPLGERAVDVGERAAPVERPDHVFPRAEGALRRELAHVLPERGVAVADDEIGVGRHAVEPGAERGAVVGEVVVHEPRVDADAAAVVELGGEIAVAALRGIGLERREPPPGLVEERLIRRGAAVAGDLAVVLAREDRGDVERAVFPDEVAPGVRRLRGRRGRRDVRGERRDVGGIERAGAGPRGQLFFGRYRLSGAPRSAIPART